MLVIGFEHSDFRVRGVLDQQIKDRTTHLVVDYTRLSAEIAELRRLVKEMRLQMGGTCAPSYSPHGSDKDSPPPPFSPLAPLF
jgi:hypothetical protein